RSRVRAPSLPPFLKDLAGTIAGVPTFWAVAFRLFALGPFPDEHLALTLFPTAEVLDGLTPRADVFERDRSQVDVAEHRLNLLPTTPPIFARARRLATPLSSTSIAPKCLAERARRIHGQFFRALGREVVCIDHSRRGRIAALHRLPTGIPLLG